ncbi:FGGY-family carbohydrate kinase [Candidatus Bipolaricaulota bacterium]|nr:FGGY-family carbohydrate kinase [Candidatus Bipolaricaulota bacterium]
MTKKYLVGSDIGTQGTKTVVVDYSGEVVGSGSSFYSVDQPFPSWAQQWPQVWEEAAYEAISEAIDDSGINPSDVAGVAISGLYGGSGVPVDEDMEPVHPCLIWMDRRATDEVSWVRENIDMDRLFDITGNYVDSYYGYTKMLWLKNNRPKIWRKTDTFVPPSSYIEYKLTGELAVDYSSAGNIGGIFDLEELEWSREACEMLGIPIDKVPGDLVASDEIIGEVTGSASDKTGLARGTPVVAGGIDAPMATLSAGAFTEGDNVAMMGTSTCWGIIHEGQGLTKELVSMPHVANSGKKIYTWGGSATTGALVNWFKNQFGTVEEEAADKTGLDPFQILDMEAEKVPPGSEGLLALPYFKGERSPIWDPEASGTLIGLSLYHSKPHVFRALLESGAYSLRHNIEIAKEIGIPLKDETSVVGGVSKSDLWTEIIADVTGRNIVIPSGGVGAPFGDALLAGVGTGTIEDYSEVEEWFTRDRVITPTERNTELYDKYYELYLELYKKGRSIMHELAELVEEE